MTTKLSIIIPCYNCEKTLKEAVVSIYQQNLTIPFEIVLVDDCSTDETRKLILELKNSYDNIKTFFHEQNRGGGATRNTAIRNSTSEIIFCLDSDDIMPVGNLKRMYDFLIDRNCDGVGIEKSIKFIGTDKTKIEAIHTFESKKGKISFDDLLQKNSLCSLYSTFMHTRKAFEIIGGYPENHGFDTQAFAWRFLANGLTAYVCPGSEYLHRVNFHRSYYVREYESGKVNHNWFKIFDEFFYIFSDETKNIIVKTNLNNYKKNLYDIVQKIESPFIPEYEKYICPDGRNNKRIEIEIKTPSRRSMYESYWLGGEYLNKENYEDALKCFTEAYKKGFRFNILKEKILLSRLCMSGKTIIQAYKEIESLKKYKKLGSQSPMIRKIFIFFKKKLRPVKVFYIELRDRRKATKFWKKALALSFLYVKKSIGIDFYNKNSTIRSIDVVIPTISKDFHILETSLRSLRNLEQNINRIYIVSQKNDSILDFCKKNGCIFLDEVTILGYHKNTLDYNVKGHDRSGWIYQQLLKLGIGTHIEKEDYLVMDSDTIFVSNNSFIQDGKYVFQESSEWHQPYFESFEKIFRRKPKNNLSSVCHMMIFNTKKVSKMREEIETIHSKKWDRVILDSLNTDEVSSFSEYETYSNWMYINYPSEIKKIPFYNKTLKISDLTDLDELQKKYGENYKSVSFHSYADN